MGCELRVVNREKTEFAEFFQASWEPCLRAVVASTGSMQLAEDQVAEAFARAWLSWRKVRRHPAPRAWVVRTGAQRRGVVVAPAHS
jgi:DNA-directed RNA polymerase specialized sigma24 family protein